MTSQKLPTQTSLFPQELPEAAKGSGRGNEEVGSDLARPVIKLLQALSPQLNPQNPAYVEDAKIGQFFNTVTGEVSENLFVSNLYYYKNWAIFKKQESGGGFEGNFSAEADAEEKLTGEDFIRNQYDIVETAHHLLAVIDTDTGEVAPAEFLMSGTKLSISKTWNANIASKGGDRFSSVWKLSSSMITKGQNTWSQIVIDFAGFTSAELHQLCTECYDGLLTLINDKKAA